MSDEKDSAYELGKRDLARLRQLQETSPASAHDVASLNEALTRAADEVAELIHGQMVRWGSLSTEKKTQYLKGAAEVVVKPELPQLLGEMERKFVGGERTALFAVINLCAEFSAPLPEWAATAFREGYARVESLEVDSWDAAFGRPKVQSQRLPETRKRRQLLGPIVHHVNMLRRNKPGQSLDWIYGEVADELGVGVKMVRELYNRGRKHKPVDGLERWRRVIPSDARPRRRR